MEENLVKKGIAEFIGTFVLTLFGCGTAVMNGATNGSIGVFGIAAAFGLSIVAMAYSIGNISGCHINPAVSFAMWISGKMSAKEMLTYWVFQFLGGIGGAALLKIICDQANLTTNLGVNGYDGLSAVGLSMIGAIIVEIVLTFVFVLVILGVTSKDSNATVTGLVIGGALCFVHLLGINLTGTSVNPARSLGPALMLQGEALSQVLVFILAPLAGAALAAFIWKYLSSKETSK